MHYRAAMVFVMLASRRISGLMFVDDLVLLADNPMDLQSALDVLHEYCLEWALSVNQNKTKVLVFETNLFCSPGHMMNPYYTKCHHIVT